MTAEERLAQHRLKMHVKALQRVIARKDTRNEILMHNARVVVSPAEAAFICCGRKLPEKGRQ